MKVRTIQADPSGNITLYVLDPVPQENRKELNRQLLALDPSVEQVGCLSFKEDQPQVEMMGGEFCGNATRSAGACALFYQGKKEGEYQVTCSGCPTPLPVSAKKIRENLYDATVQLPPPLSIGKIRLSYERESVECQEVVLPGITHYVYFTLNVDEVDQDQLFYSLQREISRGTEPEAYGLMLVEISTLKVIPIVYVSATGTLYHEKAAAADLLLWLPPWPIVRNGPWPPPSRNQEAGSILRPTGKTEKSFPSPSAAPSVWELKPWWTRTRESKALFSLDNGSNPMLK